MPRFRTGNKCPTNVRALVPLSSRTFQILVHNTNSGRTRYATMSVQTIREASYHLQHLHRRSTSAQKAMSAISPHSWIWCHTPIYLEARLLQPYAFNPQHRIQRSFNDGLVRRKPTPSISSFLTPSTCLKHFAFHVFPGPRSVTCSYPRSMPLLSLLDLHPPVRTRSLIQFE
jgi:hypothetical protein